MCLGYRHIDVQNPENCAKSRRGHGCLNRPIGTNVVNCQLKSWSNSLDSDTGVSMENGCKLMPTP